MSSTARRNCFGLNRRLLTVMSTCAVLGVVAIAGRSPPPSVVEDPETANDSGKTSDSDGDGVPDDQDGCPNDPDKTEPGNCGCGAPETPGCGSGGGHPDSVIAAIAVASFPARFAFGVAVSPNGERVYVANQGDGTISVLGR